MPPEGGMQEMQGSKEIGRWPAGGVKRNHLLKGEGPG